MKELDEAIAQWDAEGPATCTDGQLSAILSAAKSHAAMLAVTGEDCEAALKEVNDADYYAGDRECVNKAYDLSVSPKSYALIQSSLQMRGAMGKVGKALEMVLNTVGGCHDCWELSASDEDKAFVNEALRLMGVGE